MWNYGIMKMWKWIPCVVMADIFIVAYFHNFTFSQFHNKPAQRPWVIATFSSRHFPCSEKCAIIRLAWKKKATKKTLCTAERERTPSEPSASSVRRSQPVIRIEPKFGLFPEVPSLSAPAKYLVLRKSCVHFTLLFSACQGVFEKNWKKFKRVLWSHSTV